MIKPPQLVRLLYYSRQSQQLGPLEQELRAINGISVINNARAEITGLLLAHQGWFLQALEGAADAVQATYDRILRDRRHVKASVITTGPVAERRFGAWSLCARQLGASRDAAILDVLDQRGDFDPTTLNGVAALRLMSTIANVRETSPRAA